METVDIIISVVNSLQLPVWIPILIGGILRFAELKWNIFKSVKIDPKKVK